MKKGGGFFAIYRQIDSRNILKTLKFNCIYTDTEYQSKEKVSIHGFAGDYCVKGEEEWIDWDLYVNHGNGGRYIN